MDTSERGYKPYYEMTDDEKREAEQRKCDSYNAAIGTLNEDDGYDCPICKNKGFIAFVKEYENPNGNKAWSECQRKCRCAKIRQAINRMKRSGLQDVIRKYTFDSYEATTEWQNKVLETAKAFVADDNAHLFFIGGSSGSGKTHICTAIAAHYLRKGEAAHYMLWQDETVRLKALVQDEEQYRKAIEELKTITILYIDDFLKPIKNRYGNIENPTAADIKLAYELLNYRYNNPSLITIISSERYISEIIDIDEATGGRICEMTGKYMLNLKRDISKNYRLKDIEYL